LQVGNRENIRGSNSQSFSSLRIMKTKEESILGTVIEKLPNTFYKVLLEDGVIKLAYLAGKMKFNKIQVQVGDKVLVILDPYQGKVSNRIVRRL